MLLLGFCVIIRLMDPTTPQSSRSSLITIIIIIVTVAILGVSAFVYYTKPPTFSFLGKVSDQVGFYKTSLFGGISSIQSSNGEILAYAESGTTKVALVRSRDTGAVQLQKFGSGEATIPTSMNPKSGLTISDDGNKVAYSESYENTVPFSGDPADSQIVVIDLRTGDKVTVGTGILPKFISAGTGSILSYYAPEGFTIRNLESGTHISTNQFSRGTLYPIAFSNDGKYLVAYDVFSSRYMVYSISQILPSFEVTALGPLTTEYSSVTISGSHLYGAKVNEQGATQIYEYTLGRDLTVGKLVYTFPAGVTVSHLN